MTWVTPRPLLLLMESWETSIVCSDTLNKVLIVWRGDWRWRGGLSVCIIFAREINLHQTKIRGRLYKRIVQYNVVVSYKCSMLDANFLLDESSQLLTHGAMQ